MMTTNTQFQVEGAAKTMSKPRFPLTAYNLFLQVIRRRILNGTDSLNLAITPEEIQTVTFEYKTKPEKRRHRKTEGMIGFRGLSREASARWKQVDKETRNMLEEQATFEKQEYAIELKAWNAMQQQGSIKPKSLDDQQQQQSVYTALNQQAVSFQVPSFCPSLTFSGVQGFENITTGCSQTSQQPVQMQQFHQLQAFLSNLEKNAAVTSSCYESSPLEPNPLPEFAFSYNHNEIEKTTSSWVDEMEPIPLDDADTMQMQPQPYDCVYSMMIPTPLAHFQEPSMQDLLGMLSSHEMDEIFA